MKKLLWLAVASVFAGMCVAPNGDAGDRDTIRVFMRAKLDHSQKVLEGLTTDDLPLVAKHAQELALLSHAANWQVLQTEDYLQHSLEFRRAANAVTKAAREKNLDGATLAYVSMTMNCVKCHKYVRGTRVADAGGAGPVKERPAAQADR